MIRVARVEINGLTKTFRSASGELITAVDGLTLSIAAGELLVLLGPSGSGKTTTLRLIAGLDEPTSGPINIDGRSMNGVEPRDRDIAMVFQHQALFPHMTVYQNLAFGLELRKVPRAEIETRVAEAVAVLDLGGCLERQPEALSGGQRQRVALGRALVRRPGLFLFDEPLSNLDPRLRLQMRAEIARLHARLGATMIYVTHDQGEAMALADRIAVLNAGALQQLASPLELYRRPANRFVAEFIGSPPMNVLEGQLSRQSGALVFHTRAAAGTAAAGDALSLTLANADDAGLARFVGQPIALGLRPEHFTWSDNGNATGAGALEATVEVVEHLGAETYVHLSRGSQRFIARAPMDAEFGVGRKVVVQVELTRAHFFDPLTGLAVR
jgi:multiple sugar transport system ATP-binding protein